MGIWRLARLSREQHQLIRDLEERTGLTLVAYARDAAAADPAVAAALNETYRSGAATDNTTVRGGVPV